MSVKLQFDGSPQSLETMKGILSEGAYRGQKIKWLSKKVQEGKIINCRYDSAKNIIVYQYKGKEREILLKENQLKKWTFSRLNHERKLKTDSYAKKFDKRIETLVENLVKNTVLPADKKKTLLSKLAHSTSSKSSDSSKSSSTKDLEIEKASRSGSESSDHSKKFSSSSMSLSKDQKIVKYDEQVKTLSALIEKLSQDKIDLNNQIISCQSRLTPLVTQFKPSDELLKAKAEASEAYEDWLKSHYSDSSLKAKHEQLFLKQKEIYEKEAPEKDALEKELHELQFQKSQVDGEIFRKEIEVLQVNRERAHYLDAVKNLLSVQKMAFSPHANPEMKMNPKNLIEGIQSALSLKSNADLKLLCNAYSSHSIRSLLEQAKDESKEFERGEGQASLNRRLITNPNSILNDPKAMLAIFAARELQKRGDYSLPIQTTVSGWGDREVTLPGMIQAAFQSPIYFIELEVLPPNSGNDYLPLEGYIKRKEMHYLPKIMALQQASESLGNPDGASPGVSRYHPKKWDTYASNYHELVANIDTQMDQGKVKALLANRGGWSPAHLLNESRSGFRDLFAANGLKISVDQSEDAIKKIRIESTIEEIVKNLCSSHSLLDPEISHGFDRLHLVRALMDKEAYITTSDGQGYTPREIFQKMVEQFENGITLENAIAAEQLHARIFLALKEIPK